MSLKNAHVHGLRDTTVTLAFASAFHRDRCAKTDSARLIESLLEKTFRTTLRIECVLEEENQTPPGPDRDMVNLAEAAAEVF